MCCKFILNFIQIIIFFLFINKTLLPCAGLAIQDINNDIENKESNSKIAKKYLEKHQDLLSLVPFLAFWRQNKSNSVNSTSSNCIPVCLLNKNINSEQSVPIINNVNNIMIQIQQDKVNGTTTSPSNSQNNKELEEQKKSDQQLENLEKVKRDQIFEEKRKKIIADAIEQQKIEMDLILKQIKQLNSNTNFNDTTKFNALSKWIDTELITIESKWVDVIKLSGGDLVIETLSFVHAVSNVISQLNKNKDLDDKTKWSVCLKYIQLIDEKTSVPLKTNSLCHIDANLNSILNLKKNEAQIVVVAKPNSQSSINQQQLTQEEQKILESQQKNELDLISKEIKNINNKNDKTKTKFNLFLQWISMQKIDANNKWEAMSPSIKTLNLSNTLSYIITLSSIALELSENNKLEDNSKWFIVTKWIEISKKNAINDWQTKHYSIADKNLARYPEINSILESNVV